MTPHNEAKKEDIASIVLMPGDPLRAKLIAEEFLEDYKLVNSIRGMFAYTGFYKGKRITIMAHGMGMPSMGIYSYELFKFYDVESIIRIGSCIAYSKDLELFDVILSDRCYTEGNYALSLNNDDTHIVESNNELNNAIESTANELNIKVTKGNTVCGDCFDAYMTDTNKFYSRFPENFNALGGDMESFALFYNAKLLNKKAACLLSVVDSNYTIRNATAEERQTNLNNMIKLALDLF